MLQTRKPASGPWGSLQGGRAPLHLGTAELASSFSPQGAFWNHSLKHWMGIINSRNIPPSFLAVPSVVQWTYGLWEQDTMKWTQCHGKVTPHRHLHTSPSAGAVPCPLQQMEYQEFHRNSPATEPCSLHSPLCSQCSQGSRRLLSKLIGKTEIFTISHSPSRNQLLWSWLSFPRMQLQSDIPLHEPGSCHLSLRGTDN